MQNPQPGQTTSKKASSIPIMQTHRDDKSRRATTVYGKAPAEVFQFWRNFKNLPLFMKGLSQVQAVSAGETKWMVELPSGIKASWNASITEEEPGTMLAWKSLPDSQVTTSGSVWFTPSPDGRGTVVTLSMDYEIMGGRLSELATMLMGEDPDTLVQTNLRRMKAYLETGEIPTTEGQPSGREELKSGTESRQ